LGATDAIATQEQRRSHLRCHTQLVRATALPKNKKEKKCKVDFQTDAVYFWKMQLSLSKKDVAQLHIMLSTLPIPPLPVTLTLDTSRMPAGDIKTSFGMATVQIAKDSISDDKIVNTHSIIASMSFFTTWNVEKNTDDSRRAIMHAKEAVILSLIKEIIKNSETCRNEQVACTDEAVSKIFFDTTVSWIACNMPDDADLIMTNSLDFSSITYEHPLHIAMAHYCYSQGVLYSNKTSKVCCELHQSLEARYNAMKTDEETDPVRQEHLEIAEMYSEFSYSKLLNLCYTRLLKDSLYGHNYAESDNVYENAKLLLDLSVTNYNKVINAGQKQASCEIEEDLAEPIINTKSPVGVESDGKKHVCQNTVQPVRIDICNDKTDNVSGDTVQPVARLEESVGDVLDLALQPTVASPSSIDPTEFPDTESNDGNTDAKANTHCEKEANAAEVAEVAEVAEAAEAAEVAEVAEEKMVQFATKPVCTTHIESVRITHALSEAEPEDSDDNCSTITNHSATLLSPEINFMQLASYRSAAGIFMIDLISFMKNDSMHSFENIKTNLRHLHELLQVDDAMVAEACQVIHFGNLITLVKRYIAKNSPNDKHAEIVFLMDDIEQYFCDQAQRDTNQSP